MSEDKRIMAATCFNLILVWALHSLIENNNYKEIDFSTRDDLNDIIFHLNEDEWRIILEKIRTLRNEREIKVYFPYFCFCVINNDSGLECGLGLTDDSREEDMERIAYLFEKAIKIYYPQPKEVCSKA